MYKRLCVKAAPVCKKVCVQKCLCVNVSVCKSICVKASGDQGMVPVFCFVFSICWRFVLVRHGHLIFKVKSDLCLNQDQKCFTWNLHLSYINTWEQRLHLGFGI